MLQKEQYTHKLNFVLLWDRMETVDHNWWHIHRHIHGHIHTRLCRCAILEIVSPTIVVQKGTIVHNGTIVDREIS